MATAGGTNDYGETKDVNGNVLSYTSQFNEEVFQSGFVLGNPFGVSGNATVPASASLVQTNGALSASAVLTIPSASASNLTPGHVLIIQDAQGTATSSNTIAVQTPAGGGKIGAVSAATPSTSANSYAFINSAYGSIRLITNGTNWNPF